MWVEAGTLRGVTTRKSLRCHLPILYPFVEIDTDHFLPLLSRARLMAGMGRGAPSFQRYIIRISALAGVSGVGIRLAYLTFRWRIQFFGVFYLRGALSCGSITTPLAGEREKRFQDIAFQVGRRLFELV